MDYLYSGGLNILVCYLYSGGLSLLCWAVFIPLAVHFWCVIFINLLGCLYSGGLKLFCWAVFVLVGCLYSGGPYVLVDYLYSGGPSVFWWAAYNLSLLSCGQFNEIVDYFFQLCVHTLHSILQNVCFIELPCQP